MGSRYKISISLSVALALFYSMPWIALSEQVRLAGFSLRNMPVGPRVTYLFCTVLFAAAMLFQYNLFLKHKLPVKGPWFGMLVNVFANLTLVVLLSALSLIVAKWIFSISAPNAYFTFYFFRNASIAIVVMLVTYAVELVDRLRREKIEVLMLQHQNTETELAALRSQMDPHFLFNTLATLSSLVRANSKETTAFIDHLSDTFRYMLEKREHKLVAVKEELHFLQSYLFMMKQRFNDGLLVNINIDDSVMQKNMPQFALQVAVENAIKHNVVSPKNALCIEFFSSGQSITVRNNLQRKVSGTGYSIGLANLSQRYRLTAGKDISVKTGEQYFELDLPLI